MWYCDIGEKIVKDKEYRRRKSLAVFLYPFAGKEVRKK